MRPSPPSATRSTSGFCNGPLGVESLSDCPVAEVLLLFGVGARPPHHAIREDAVSPSKTRAPPRSGAHGTTYGLTASITRRRAVPPHAQSHTLLHAAPVILCNVNTPELVVTYSITCNHFLFIN